MLFNIFFWKRKTNYSIIFNFIYQKDILFSKNKYFWEQNYNTTKRIRPSADYILTNLTTMLKQILFYIIIVMSMSTNAQTQQGVVKTRGRMINGMLQRGKGLGGATIHVTGQNAMVSSLNGNFKMRLANKTYHLQNVIKQGYQLVDMEICRSHTYSPDPLYLVMERPDTLFAEERKKTRELRRLLRRRIEQEEDKVEALKISEEEKRQLQDELDRQRENNEKIAEELSRYCITIDYDQLDDFQREICELTEKGEADSAIAKLRSRGNIDTLIQVAKTYQKDIENICMDYYRGFLVKHQNDSAGYYLNKLLEIDSLNIDYLNNIGHYQCEYLSDYKQAHVVYERALALSMALYGKNDDRTATCHNNIGNVYYYQGRYDDALKHYNLALDIKRETMGNDNPDIATYQNNIGNVYHKQQKMDLALQLHKEALTLRQHIFGNNHPEVATSLNNIGSIYRDQQEYPKALDYYHKSLTIRTKILGDDSPATATCHNNIGLTYQRMDSLAKATTHYMKAFAIRENILGKEHTLVGTTCNNIGTLYYQQGDIEQALAFLLRAMKIREKKLGTLHTSTANTYTNLGAIYQSKGDTSQARNYYQKALDIYRQKLGSDNPNVKNLQNKIHTMDSEE